MGHIAVCLDRYIGSGLVVCSRVPVPYSASSTWHGMNRKWTAGTDRTTARRSQNIFEKFLKTRKRDFLKSLKIAVAPTMRPHIRHFVPLWLLYPQLPREPIATAAHIYRLPALLLFACIRCAAAHRCIILGPSVSARISTAAVLVPPPPDHINSHSPPSRH